MWYFHGVLHLKNENGFLIRFDADLSRMPHKVLTSHAGAIRVFVLVKEWNVLLNLFIVNRVLLFTRDYLCLLLSQMIPPLTFFMAWCTRT
jgi:hypothetical protein